MSYFTRNLKDDEEVIRLIKHHDLSYCFSGLLSLIALLLPFFLMGLFFRWGKIGFIIFAIFSIFGLWAIIRFLVVRHYNGLLITDRRVILFKQKGFFDRQVMEIEYDKIQDVSYRFKGISQTLFRYGTLNIQVQSSESVIKAEKIPRPESVQDLIKDIRKNYSAQTENSSAESLLKLAQTLKSKPGIDKFKNSR
jgi:hypothetical protein